MDYLTPLARRTSSFKEFVEEWVLDQFDRTCASSACGGPGTGTSFLDQLDVYHHMVYASAYTYRAMVWFDLAMPGPEERKWLRRKYPKHCDSLDAVWDRVAERWSKTDPGVEWGAHGTAIVTFCDLCQLVLCGGAPPGNTAQVLNYDGKKYIFCSEPCRWIFEREPARYAGHKDW
jgi:toluene monooxygenase system protein A